MLFLGRFASLVGKLSGDLGKACCADSLSAAAHVDKLSACLYNVAMTRKRKTTPEDDAEYGLTVPEKPCSTEEREKLAQWSVVASLVAYKGMSLSAAYRQVYDAPEGTQCPATIRGSRKFQSLLTKMRAAQGMSDEQAKGCIESLYLSTVTDDEAPLKQRLQAAQQWQKLRGLEKIKEVQAIDADELIWQQAMTRSVKVLDAEPEKG